MEVQVLQAFSAKDEDEDVKCPQCNWDVPTIYHFKGTDAYKEGACAECFMPTIVGKVVILD